MSGIRRDRSRSPMRIENIGRRRDNMDISKGENNMAMNAMNQMMMANMYQHGNMMISGGMYPNMMMPNTMMATSMIPTTSMEMMSAGGIELLPQQQMDISGMTPQSMQPQQTTLQPSIPPSLSGSMPSSLQSPMQQSIQSSMQPPMDMNMMGGMMVDPTMMNLYQNLNNDMPIQEKKEIVLKHCILTPPPPGTPQPPRRPKPPGCRTIFVGGLPEKIRESIVREIFEEYGRIVTLRLSKKNFCHIRFDRESCVDAAMEISGFCIKLTSRDKDKDGKDKESSDESDTTGWLHVDYALSRDDQSDYERRQRQALRVQQAQMQQIAVHQENMMRPRRSPSPIRIQPFSNNAILQLAEKVKSEEQFSNSLPTLIAWLERGECSKKNSNQFYTMLQATNSHIRRLFNEKMQAEEELQTCRDRIKTQIGCIIEQLEQVAKVFTAATHQRVWDHFTKPQRKNIETWQKMTQEFHTLKEEFTEKFCNDEMSEYGNGTYNIINTNTSNEELQQLKRENESLQFQLEAYKNEVDVIKSDAQKEMEKFKAQFIARQALQDVKKQPPLPSAYSKPPPPPPLPDEKDNTLKVKESVDPDCGEAKLIGTMSAFLHVHPQGASLDYIVSYIRALFPQINQSTVHHVLQKHNEVFQLTTSGVGANIENRWSFIAFKSD